MLIEHKMESLHKYLFISILIFALGINQRSVEANFAKGMYIFWGRQHSSIQGNGDDLQLVLDNTSGMNSSLSQKQNELNQLYM